MTDTTNETIQIRIRMPRALLARYQALKPPYAQQSLHITAIIREWVERQEAAPKRRSTDRP